MGSKRVIRLSGIDCQPGAEEKFNTWYSEVHIPMLLKYKGITRVTRYKKLDTDEEYPTYFTIYEFDSKEAFEGYTASPEFAVAMEDLRNTWPEGGYKRKWRVQYEEMRTWHR